MKITTNGLFYCKIGLQNLQRTPGTDICLRCPLPEGYCVNGGMTHKSVRQRFDGSPPACLLAHTVWCGVTLAQGEELARQILNADDPRTIDKFRAALIKQSRTIN